MDAAARPSRPASPRRGGRLGRGRGRGLAAGFGAGLAAGFAAAGVVALAAGFDAAAVVGLDAVFFAAALGFAGLGWVGASAAAIDAADAFGFAAVVFAVDDFGAPFAPALGVAFLRAAGLRADVPAAARAVRVEPGVAAPVLVPPARVGAAAGASVVVGVASSE